MAFAMNTAPTGWLECDGAPIARTTYATLFAAIGETFGSGDGSSTFNLPDLRGVFVRGWANTKANVDADNMYDAGRNFGTEQADAFKSHTHTFRGVTGSSGFGDGSRESQPTTRNTDATGDVETRPRNVALMHCIKT
jgi:microcystin-dependent protein